jgi:hypothetical protein
VAGGVDGTRCYVGRSWRARLETADSREGAAMGLMDTIKGWFGGNKQQVKEGIDKGADEIKETVPDEHDTNDEGAEAAKDAVDKLD